MKYAYLILVHQQPELFIRLVKSLNNENAVFIVHVDAKIDEQPFRRVEDFVDASKFTWLKQQSIVWAGFNSIKVTLDGLRAAADLKDVSHVTFISGQDYPIKPVEQYQQFLAVSNGGSFMEYRAMPRPDWGNGGMDRINYYHVLFGSFRLAWPLFSYVKIKLRHADPAKWKLLRKVTRFVPVKREFPRKFLNGYKPYEGSNWFTLSTPLINLVIKELETNKSFYNFFKYTHHADEIFFQTLIINRFPEHLLHIQNKNVTHVHWNDTTGRPITFTEVHFNELKDSDRFFARKFDDKSSSSLLDKIDRELLSIPVK